MKYAVQIIISCVIWFLVQSMGGKITLEPANIYLKSFNIALFLFSSVVCFVGYITFIQREEVSGRKICYTKAQWSCLVGCGLSLSYAYTTWLWIRVVESGYNHPEKIDILNSVNGIMLVITLVLNADLLNNTFFQKSFLPFGNPIPRKKKALLLAKEMGFITEEQIHKVLDQQDKGGTENDRP